MFFHFRFRKTVSIATAMAPKYILAPDIKSPFGIQALSKRNNDYQQYSKTWNEWATVHQHPRQDFHR